MPLVFMPLIPWSHLEREWQVPDIPRMMGLYIESFMVIRYDHRRCGLSERDVTDRSVDAYLLDLEAVVEHLGLERFPLFGRGPSAPVAISYTARNPERVSRLLLGPLSYARASDYYAAQVEPIYSLMEVHWELFTETSAHAALGWSRGEAARGAAAFFRDCVTQEEALAA